MKVRYNSTKKHSCPFEVIKQTLVCIDSSGKEKWDWLETVLASFDTKKKALEFMESFE